MKKFLAALIAFSVLAAPLAEAGSGYKKPKRHANVERIHKGGHGVYKPRKGNHNRWNNGYNGNHNRWNRRNNGNYNRWNGGHNGNNSNNNHHNNYYYDNRHNYNNNNDGGRFYKNPYFWGGVASGLIGGAIIRDQYYYDEPECETIWTQVYVSGEGYRNVQRVVCD